VTSQIRKLHFIVDEIFMLNNFYIDRSHFCVRICMEAPWFPKLEALKKRRKRQPDYWNVLQKNVFRVKETVAWKLRWNECCKKWLWEDHMLRLRFFALTLFSKACVIYSLHLPLGYKIQQKKHRKTTFFKENVKWIRIRKFALSNVYRFKISLCGGLPDKLLEIIWFSLWK
jgi:hypothetical protein